MKVSEDYVKPPSLLASLLAQRKSSVTIPPCSKMTPPLCGSTHTQRLLPYIPHSPFHLFSYDMEEEVELKQRNSERYTAPGEKNEHSRVLVTDDAEFFTCDL